MKCWWGKTSAKSLDTCIWMGKLWRIVQILMHWQWDEKTLANRWTIAEFTNAFSDSVLRYTVSFFQ